MFQTLEEQLKEIQRKIIMLGLLDAPGMIMLALWAYAKFGSNNEPFHPVLANPVVIDGLLFVGGTIVVLCAYQVVMLSLKRVKIQKEHNM